MPSSFNTIQDQLGLYWTCRQ